MSLSRNHHYIPRMYLSKWGKDNNIYVYRLLVSNDSVVKWEKRSVEHTGSLKNLYINIQNDTEYDTLEHFFNTKIESPAKLALDKICSEEKMTSADWDKISDFVTAQWIRTPKFYIWTKDAGVGIISNGINEISKQIPFLKDISKEKRTISDPVSFLPMEVIVSDPTLNKDNTDIEISSVSGKGFWMFGINSLLEENTQVRNHFRYLNWSIITSPNDISFPTCDAPVVIFEKNNTGFSLVHPDNGLLGKNKGVLFPVSPHKAIVGMPKRTYGYRCAFFCVGYSAGQVMRELF